MIPEVLILLAAGFDAKNFLAGCVMEVSDLQDMSLEQTLFHLHEPILFKNVLRSSEDSNSWKILDWSLHDFANKLGNRKLPFRVGKNIATDSPQWEVETPTKNKTMKEFLQETMQGSNSQWYYFDYKRMNQWFEELPEILESIDWSQFGSELTGYDSTIWIGSKGAHTNCHQDTYGCNLVAQTHGRKFWLLFSPDCYDRLKVTRVPYEESTIYSSFNFFSPGDREIQAIKKMMPGSAKIIVLEPKDVLFIPRGWWHYVESLNTSLSINVWLPVEEDCNARLRETLVHLVMDTIGKDITRTEHHQESTVAECFQFVQNSLEECQKVQTSDDEVLAKRRRPNIDQERLLSALKEKYSRHVQHIADLTSENLILFLKKNDVGNSFNSQRINIHQNQELSKEGLYAAVVDAFCHPSVISRVSEILVDRFVEKKSDDV
ncbi:hypothetical protein QAD02_018989 [Eretmocerus hayati]|uniref:Uncharacterized protein n=1 Tax=Eretmocerus hayati TaxID=131215 RepID=A0ACC2PIJ5_9HYME|nr:hypothetical protein QAD02_018989 [Eretmocerus hayati]